MKKPALPPHSHIARHELFQAFDGDGETVAESRVQVRHGVRWVSTVWIKNGFRRHGLGRQLLREVIEAYQSETLWLQVLAFDGQPMPDEKLMQWYTGFGFCASGAPGILTRPPGPLTLD